MDKKIIWLASYPKSGNTWMRVFLSALTAGTELHLRKLAIEQFYQDVDVLTRNLDIDCRLLTQSEVEYYQPLAWEQEANLAKWPFFIKTHDTYRRNHAGKDIHSPEVTDRAVYIVRNPLDVCVSLKYFRGISIDEAISFMNDNNASSGRFPINPNTQFPGFLSSWSANVTGWINNTDFPVQVIRYEDLLDKPVAEFTRVVRFLNLDYTDKQITSAVTATQFENLAKMEKETGFDRPSTTDAFFRKGTKNQWKQELTDAQVDRIVSANYETMKILNYI